MSPTLRQPVMDTERVVDVLVESAVPVLRREYSPDCCILATRHAIEALNAFGVTARPVPVEALVYNAEAVALLNSGLPAPELAERMSRIPRTQPGGPWSLGVQPDHPDSDPSRWGGHLVAVVDRMLIDLSLPQVNRPHKNIELRPVVLGLDAQWDVEGVASFTGAHGELVGYQRLADDDRRWRQAPDWTWPSRNGRRRLHRQNAAEIIRAMRQSLQDDNTEETR